MKYRDSDIILVKSDNIFKFKDLIPTSDEYMYLKVLNTGRIIICKGKFLRSIFKLKNLEKKSIYDIKIEFFSDYLNALFDKVKEEHIAYQFNFQYKDNITLYSCSIYPCMVYDDCKSFDVVIRKNNERIGSKQEFFTEL